jgi:RNA polymerase sigma factor (sigma-70 family)
MVHIASRERESNAVIPSSAKLRPTVFVVDDEPEIRRSLRWLIESVGLPVETYESGQEFLAQVDLTRPGCIVLDVRMPEIGGLELQSRVIQANSVLPIIVISAYADVPMAVRALSNGALHFLEKPFSDQVLLDKVQEALTLNADRRRERHLREEIETKLGRLTPRERSVLERVVHGMPNKEIARSLGLSEKTIEVHRAHVMQKMEAGSVAELVRVTFGFISPPTARD